MKRFYLLAFFVAIAGLHGQGEETAVMKANDDKGAIYLHCFRQTHGQRVVLDPENDKDEKPATPPARLVTLRVADGRPFEVIYSSMHQVSGRISTKEGSYHATLEGAFGSGFKFAGKIELEQVFDTEVTWFSGAVFPSRCVFSRDKDIGPFLKAQAKLDAAMLAEATERTRRNRSRSATPRREAEQ